MALSGTINGYYSGYTYRISWSASQNVSGNYSTITCSHSLICGSGYDLYISGRSNSCTVNVETKSYSSSAINTGGNSTISLGTTTHTVYHNSDGTKSVSIKGAFNMQATIAGSYVSSITASATVTLDAIPRTAYVTSAPNFTDDDNPTIGYSNPMGSSVDKLEACIASTDGKTIYIDYRDIDKSGTSYTFNLTSTERNKLRDLCKNARSMSVRFYICTTKGGSYFYSSLEKTLTIASAEPTISVSVKDVNEGTYALTGSRTTFISGYSNLQYVISATAKKSATITSYSARIGSRVINSTLADGVVMGVDTASFSFSATDSRGYSETTTVNGTLIDYVPLLCHLEVGTPTADGKCSLTIEGPYFNGSFGKTSNTLTVQYRYSTNGGSSWGSWTNATATKSGNSYKASVTVTNLDYQKAYTFQAKATDKLKTEESYTYTVRAYPVFDWGENDFNFNVPIKVNGEPLDYPVASGTSGGWTWTKYASGQAVCWGSFTVNTGSFSWWDGGSYIRVGANPLNNQDFPIVDFKSAPSVVFSVHANESMACYGIADARIQHDELTETPRIWIVPGSSASEYSSISATVEFHVKGRWQ